MTDQQKEHRAKIMQAASMRIHAKYEAGAIEHGGLLSDLSADALLENAIDEAVDQVVYLLTLKDKLDTHNISKIQ